MRRRSLLKDKATLFSPTFNRNQDIELNSLQKRVEDIKKIQKGHSKIYLAFGSTFSSEKLLLEEKNHKIEENFIVFTKFDVLKALDYDLDQAVKHYERNNSRG